jgi:Fur family ferric uptake transcriptional regulator
MSTGHPLPEKDIKDRLSGNFDRSTLYRSLITLEEKGIIHRIVVDHQTTMYALDHSLTAESNHAHFYCKKCKRIKCLEEYIVSIPELPEGYLAVASEMIVKGTCDECTEPGE